MKVDPRLEKISPNWYRRIKRAKTVGGLLRKITLKIGIMEHTLNLKDYPSCIVGEAFDFSEAYRFKAFNDNTQNCKKCYSISQRFPWGPSHSWQNNSLSYFRRVVKEFCNHVEKDHGVNLN